MIDINDTRIVCAALLTTPAGCTDGSGRVHWPFGVDRAEGAARLIGLDPGAYYVPGPGRRADGGPPLGRDAARREIAVAAAVAGCAGGLRTLGTAPTTIESASAGFGRGETPALRGKEAASWGDLFRAVGHDAAGLAAAVRLAASAGVAPVPARGGLPPQEFVDVAPSSAGEARRWSF